MSSYLECVERCIAKFEDSMEFVTSEINNRLDQLSEVSNIREKKKLLESERVFFEGLKKRIISKTIPIILEDIDCMLKDIHAEFVRKSDFIEGNFAETGSLPRLSNPSSRITARVVSGDMSQIGSTVTVEVSTSFDRGSIQPAYGTNGMRSGDVVSFNVSGPGSDQMVELNTPYLIDIIATEEDITWTLDVTVADGEQPLSEHGVEYSTPYAGGPLPTSTATLSGGVIVNEPWFATMNGLDVSVSDRNIHQTFVEIGSTNIYELALIDEYRRDNGMSSYRYIPLTLSGVLYPNDKGYTGVSPQYKYGFRIPVSWGEIDMVATEFLGEWVLGSAWHTNNTSGILNISNTSVRIDGKFKQYYQVLRRSESENPSIVDINIRIYLKEI